MRRLTPVRVSSLRSCSYGEGCFPTPLRRRGLLMIHLGCEKGLERPFSLFCHFVRPKRSSLASFHRIAGIAARFDPTFAADLSGRGFVGRFLGLSPVLGGLERRGLKEFRGTGS